MLNLRLDYISTRGGGLSHGEPITEASCHTHEE